MTHHAEGIGTCTQSESGMTNPSYPSSEIPYWMSELGAGLWTSEQRFARKAKNLTRALQWIKEIEAAKSLWWPQHTKIHNGPRFPWLRRHRIRWWRQHWKGVTISKHTFERRSVSKSKELRRTTDFSEGGKSLIWSMNIFDLLDPMMKFKDYRRGVYVSKLQDSSQAQTIMAQYNQEILRGRRQRDHHRLRMCVKLHNWTSLKK